MARDINVNVTAGQAGQYEAMVTRIRQQNERMYGDAIRGAEQAAARNRILEQGLFSLKNAFIGVFSVGAVIAYTKHIADLAGNIQDLSERTGISAQTLSGIRSTLQQSGVSLDQFARGIQLAQRNLGALDDDGNNATKALRALGLNVEVLKKTSPENFLRQFSQGLSTVADQNQRAAIAAAVLGKSGTELIPVLAQLSGNLEKLRNEGLSDDTIRAIDDMGDAWTRWSVNLEHGAIRTAESLLKRLGLIPRSVREIEAELEKKRQGGFVEKLLSGEKDIPRLELELARARQAIDDRDRAGFPAGGDQCEK